MLRQDSDYQPGSSEAVDDVWGTRRRKRSALKPRARKAKRRRKRKGDKKPMAPVAPVAAPAAPPTAPAAAAAAAPVGAAAAAPVGAACVAGPTLHVDTSLPYDASSWSMAGCSPCHSPGYSAADMPYSPTSPAYAPRDACPVLPPAPPPAPPCKGWLMPSTGDGGALEVRTGARLVNLDTGDRLFAWQLESLDWETLFWHRGEGALVSVGETTDKDLAPVPARATLRLLTWPALAVLPDEIAQQYETNPSQSGVWAAGDGSGLPLFYDASTHTLQFVLDEGGLQALEFVVTPVAHVLQDGAAASRLDWYAQQGLEQPVRGTGPPPHVEVPYLFDGEICHQLGARAYRAMNELAAGNSNVHFPDEEYTLTRLDDCSTLVDVTRHRMYGLYWAPPDSPLALSYWAAEEQLHLSIADCWGNVPITLWPRCAVFFFVDGNVLRAPNEVAWRVIHAHDICTFTMGTTELRVDRDSHTLLWGTTMGVWAATRTSLTLSEARAAFGDGKLPREFNRHFPEPLAIRAPAPTAAPCIELPIGIGAVVYTAALSVGLSGFFPAIGTELTALGGPLLQPIVDAIQGGTYDLTACAGHAAPTGDGRATVKRARVMFNAARLIAHNQAIDNERRTGCWHRREPRHLLAWHGTTATAVKALYVAPPACDARLMQRTPAARPAGSRRAPTTCTAPASTLRCRTRSTRLSSMPRPRPAPPRARSSSRCSPWAMWSPTSGWAAASSQSRRTASSATPPSTPAATRAPSSCSPPRPCRCSRSTSNSCSTSTCRQSQLARPRRWA